jgi:hypothetical protein
MKYNINYKAKDTITNNPIIDIEQDQNIALEIKQLVIPVINAFKKLEYDFFSGRNIQKKENNKFVNDVTITLRNKSYERVILEVNYNDLVSIMSAFAYKKKAYSDKEFINFTKKELRILDAYDFELPWFFVEETHQNIEDWIKR